MFYQLKALTPRPPALQVSWYLSWLIIALGLITSIWGNLADPLMPSSVHSKLLLESALSSVIPALCVFFTYRGYQWARWLWAFMLIGSLPFTSYVLRCLPSYWSWLALDWVIQSASRIIITVLLFLPASNAWFRQLNATSTVLATPTNTSKF